MSDVTQILSQIEQGDAHAAQKLLPLLYDELRRLAAAKLASEKPGQTLQATALVHEAYLRLVGPACREAPDAPKTPGNTNSQTRSGKAGANHFDSRGHFFAAAAEAMRRILVENARRKNRLKHGGDLDRVELELEELPTRMRDEELLALDEALQRLQQEDPVKARLVTLRYFAGLTIEQASEVLDISRVTAFRYWTFARAWLHREIRGEPPNPPESE